MSIFIFVLSFFLPLVSQADIIFAADTCDVTADCSAGATCVASMCENTYTWPFILNGHLWDEYNESAPAEWFKHCRDDLNVTYNKQDTSGKLSHTGSGLIQYICKEDEDQVDHTGTHMWVLNGSFPVSQQYCKSCNDTVIVDWCSQWSLTNNLSRGNCPDYCPCNSGDCNCCPLWDNVDNSSYDNYVCCGHESGKELHIQSYCSSTEHCRNVTSTNSTVQCFYPRPNNNYSKANYDATATFLLHCADGPKLIQNDKTYVCCQQSNCTNNYCTTHEKCRDNSATGECINYCSNGKCSEAGACQVSS